MKKLIGKIFDKIDENYGYIIGEDGNKYLFSTFDILDDLKIVIGTNVVFKPTTDIILRATYVSKLEEGGV